jgi:hypothetical protein
LKQRFFLIFDGPTHSVHIAGGLIIAEFGSHEEALRAARTRGIVLTDRHPNPVPGKSGNGPPASSADAVTNILTDPGTPEAARAALAEAADPPTG